MALSDIRRDRHGCPAKLARDSVEFRTRKRCRDSVAAFDEVHSAFPSVEIFVSEGPCHALLYSRIDSKRNSKVFGEMGVLG